MDWDRVILETDRLVIAKRSYPRAGIALAVLGPVSGIAIMGLTLIHGGTTFIHLLLLFLGLVLMVGSVPWGAVLAHEARLVLDKGAGLLRSSWKVFGLEHTSTQPLSNYIAVGWEVEERTEQGAGDAGGRTYTVYPVKLQGCPAYRTRVLLTASEADRASRFAREVGEFLGIEQVRPGEKRRGELDREEPASERDRLA